MNSQDWNVNGSDVSLAGWHIALVVDNNDPKACERVLIRVMGVHDMDNESPDNAIWADAVGSSKFSSGDIPDVGDWLYIQFPHVTNPMRALYFGWVRGMVE